MRNLELAGLLSEVAALLEIKGDNPFRVRAYRRAAEAIALLGEDVAQVVADGRLHEIKGVGKGIAAAIEEWLATGTMEVHRQLLEEVPAGLLELLTLPGIGPKTAITLYKEAGVDSLAALQEALDTGRLQGVKGIGPKTQEALREALRTAGKQKDLFPVGVALPLAEGLLRALREHPAARRVELAGSLRRGKEWIRDVDLVAASDDPEALTEYFLTLPGIKETVRTGPTSTRVLLYNGLPVDLRVVEPDAFVAAWHHFTGSQAHNIRLRERARRRGLRINEYGLTYVQEQAAGGNPGPAEAGVAGKGGGRGRGAGGPTVIRPQSEEELYRLLGLPFIPPELREDRGELEAAERGQLPLLVEWRDLRGDLHCHTTWSDGVLLLEQLAAEAARRGWEYVAVTDHSPHLRIAGGLDPQRLRLQGEAIDRLQEQYPSLRILKGVEVDILADGSLDLPDEVLAGLDVVVASVHSRFQQDEEEMTRRIVKAMENPHVDILAHPTGRLLGRRDPYRVRMEALVETAVRTGVALEINSHPDRLDLKDEQVRMAVEAGALIAINSDMHRPEEFDNLPLGVKVARRGWASPPSVVNTWDWPRLEAWLRRN